MYKLNYILSLVKEDKIIRLNAAHLVCHQGCRMNI